MSGLQEQVEADRAGRFLLSTIGVEGLANEQSVTEEIKQMKQKYRTVEEEDEENNEMAWGDVSGVELDPAVVRKARQEDIDFLRKMKL